MRKFWKADGNLESVSGKAKRPSDFLDTERQAVWCGGARIRRAKSLMADPDDILKRYGPTDPRWLTPEDLADRKLHPASVNQFALPPREPRAELRNPALRPDAYVDKNTREYVMGPGPFALTMLAPAFMTGQTAGQAYNDLAAGDYKAATPSLAELLVGMAPIPGMKKGAIPPRVENPIRAYHGSPHDFDKFDLSKIGTGEGAQAYGHGAYLAESEAVAKQYRDKLAPKTSSEAAAQELAESHGLNWNSLNVYDRLSYIEEADKLAVATQKKPGGHMYEVAIHATPDQFLDWDKPLSQQSEAVRKALSEVRAAQSRPEIPADATGQDAWKRVMRSGLYDTEGRQKQLPEMAASSSDFLREAGIPGIRYLDQGSRGAGQGTSNYVVFDPNLIEILRKYGIAGPVAGLTTADILAKYGRNDGQ